MKKFLCVLIAAMTMCLLTSVVSAKKIVVTDNTSEATAAQFNSGDTLLVDGVNNRYYKYKAPYSGTLTMKIKFHNKVYTHTSSHFRIFHYEVGDNPVKKNVYYDQSNTYTFTLTMIGGNSYYIMFDDSYGTGENDVLNVDTSFTCLHTETEESVDKATCSEAGLREVFCLDCEEIIETEELAKLDHVYGEWEVIKEPTATSEGTERRKCKICKQSESRSFVPKHGEYGKWMVTENSTCSKEGTESFICFCCNKATETRALEKAEHSYGKWLATSAASPEKDGVETAYCIVCQDAKTRSFAYDFAALRAKAEKPAGFTDVSSTDWFSGVVGKCNHYGLMLGNSETTFNPGGNITVAEAITASVRIFCLYNPTLPKPVTGTDPWYNGYVNYAIANGIINPGDFADYTVPATREQMAYIFANAAGAENLTAINNYQWIPDVYADNPYRNEIFMLYNAGILTGSDANGTFNPKSNITRAEAAAIIARIAKITERVQK